MAGGKSPKRKGDAGELEFCKLYGGERTFWQPEQTDKRGDVKGVPHLGTGEIKRRGDAWKELYRWLEPEEVKFLGLRADRKRWLIVMDAEELFELMGRVEREGIQI
jgi:hypothetical protein